ncbi:MAG: polyprenyl synthetase family protein [Candidatus Thermoplasmatota archaeon]
MAGAAVRYHTVDGKDAESAFLGFIADHRQAIQKRVFDFLPSKPRRGSILHEHYAMVRDYPERGGKYVRPGLLLLSCAASGREVSRAMTTAAAMEISEDWILIHDDFQDRSLERRGQPALPVIYGPELSVNAGNHLHVIMWNALLANTEALGAEHAVEISREMSQILQRTCEGQYLDLCWTLRGGFITERQYYEMVDRKTGWYTIIGPLRLGALVARHSKALSPLINFGIPLGRAFQIHDDWLNVFSRRTGKKLGDDILEGKRTLLLIHLLECLEKGGRAKKAGEVRSLFSKRREERTWSDVQDIIHLYEAHGCREWVRARALRCAEQAKRALNQVPYRDKRCKAILSDAVDFLVNREL